MYNSKYRCLDEELTFLSFNQKINKSFKVNELSSSGLWVVEEINDVLRCIPLFNCDYIVSSNSDDIVLDNNQCLICHNDDATVISCISDDNGSIHYYDISLYAYTPYSKLDLVDTIVIYCVVYDNYLNTLNNVPINVLINNELVNIVNTDNKGICKYSINEACNISFNYGEIESNVINIVEE